MSHSPSANHSLNVLEISSLWRTYIQAHDRLCEKGYTVLFLECADDLLEHYLAIVYSDVNGYTDTAKDQLKGVEFALVHCAKVHQITGDMLRQVRRALVWAYLSICHDDRVEPDTEVAEITAAGLDWWETTLNQVTQERGRKSAVNGATAR